MKPLFDSIDLDKLKEANKIFCTEPKEIYDSSNPEHTELREYLNITIGGKFKKILNSLLEDPYYCRVGGRIDFTGQGGPGKIIFKGYFWQKICPKGYANDKIVFTIGISCENKNHIGFEIKIDSTKFSKEKLSNNERNWDYILEPDFTSYSKEQFVNRIKQYVTDNLEHYKNLLYKYVQKSNNKKQPLNQILYGPPGTGKTFSIKKKVNEILEHYDEPYIDNLDELVKKDENDTGYTLAFTTFHPAYGYEEFIERIRPETDGDKLSYPVESGVFKELCDIAKKNMHRPYFMIIDEINRGNIPKIFGELITLIEDNKRGKFDENGNLIQDKDSEAISVTLPYSKHSFSVPSNAYIIGTMNTADKSLVALDTALRRRFVFKEMPPKPNLLSNNIGGIDVKRMLKDINSRIPDRAKKIGHAFFINCKTDTDVTDALQYKIIPLIQEYEYDDWKKICTILGISDYYESNMTETVDSKKVLRDDIKFSKIAKKVIKKYVRRINTPSVTDGNIIDGNWKKIEQNKYFVGFEIDGLKINNEPYDIHNPPNKIAVCEYALYCLYQKDTEKVKECSNSGTTRYHDFLKHCVSDFKNEHNLEFKDFIVKYPALYNRWFKTEFPEKATPTSTEDTHNTCAIVSEYLGLDVFVKLVFKN